MRLRRLLAWAAVAGVLAGLAGAIYTFSKGAISPDVAAIPRSVDGLVMVLMGGLQTLTGPVLGAAPAPTACVGSGVGTIRRWPVGDTPQRH